MPKVRAVVEPTTARLQVRRPKYGHNLDIYDEQNRQQDGEKYQHIVSKTAAKTVAKHRQKGASMDISTAKL